MSRKLLIGFAATAIAVGTALTAATPAQAKPTTPASSTVTAKAGLSAEVAATVKGAGAEAQQKALESYWTPARMNAAKPESEIPAVKAAAKAGPQAAAATARPSGPATKIDPVSPKADPAPAAPTGVQPMSYYPNYPVGHPTARTAGKVFFTIPGYGNYVCSGTIVNTEGKSAVWTAGHCVSDYQRWNTNWTFVPNYDNGSRPYGTWSAYSLTTTTAWFNNNNDYANDVGAAIMYRNSGYRIADYLGAQGIAWNYSVGGYTMYAFGYPAAAPFNGQRLVANSGMTYNGSSYWAGTIYMVNDMTGGSSGGAWLNWFDGNWGYINGHNDFKFTALPQYMFSPYYTTQVSNVYNAVRYTST